MKDLIYMNDYYNEPEIILVGDINDIEALHADEFKALNKKTISFLNEDGYHNTYYLGKGKYGTRTLKMKNTEYLKLNNNG